MQKKKTIWYFRMINDMQQKSIKLNEEHNSLKLECQMLYI